MASKRAYKISRYNLEGEQFEGFLGPLGAEILETVWDSGDEPVTVRQVYEELKKRTKIAYTTVMSTMDRLYDKGILDRRVERGKGGVYFVYWPKLGKKSFEESAVKTVVSSLFRNFGSTVTNAFVDEVASNQEDLEALQKQIQKLAQDRKK
ncbi:MAG TPA: BlaI/MecI/CopY family transcriptional regulator [Conexivisphaerales archaeon]|nr:BlaI/MecI/CopY family transcriptional regulator [Conexivisphaerales archaeon]